ncbi:MAG: 50S ribosomal protein L31 [Vigna little leaf phytoplasma]|nr:50S ribosomal protein L31 [Vigna little leaf phytoplasma]MDV3198273.1 50S ribosomal protein L31 [Vigna little leaf phytoplasma]
MKKKLKQPDFFETEVTCATCSKKHIILTTVKNMKIETCSNCHFFYTNSQVFVTAAGQVNKFHKRYGNNEKNKN